MPGYCEACHRGCNCPQVEAPDPATADLAALAAERGFIVLDDVIGSADAGPLMGRSRRYFKDQRHKLDGPDPIPLPGGQWGYRLKDLAKLMT